MDTFPPSTIHQLDDDYEDQLAGDELPNIMALASRDKKPKKNAGVEFSLAARRIKVRQEAAQKIRVKHLVMALLPSLKPNELTEVLEAEALKAEAELNEDLAYTNKNFEENPIFKQRMEALRNRLTQLMEIAAEGDGEKTSISPDLVLRMLAVKVGEKALDGLHESEKEWLKFKIREYLETNHPSLNQILLELEAKVYQFFERSILT